MVLCGVDPERRASKELEKKISLWMKEYNKAIKILLLGVLLRCVVLGCGEAKERCMEWSAVLCCLVEWSAVII